MELTIRPAGEPDGVSILACLREAFEPYRSAYTPAAFLDTVLTPESLRDRLQSMHVFVAVTLGGVIGTIAAGIVGGGEGHLRGMAVVPAWQGQGLADRLLERALAELRARGCTLVTLDTTEPLERAVRFYRAQGFTATGRVADFFGMRLYEYARRLD